MCNTLQAICLPSSSRTSCQLVLSDTGIANRGKWIAILIRIRPSQEDAEALSQWTIQVLKTGALSTSTNDSARADATRAAVASLMVLLRNEKLRVVFVKLGGVAP